MRGSQRGRRLEFVKRSVGHHEVDQIGKRETAKRDRERKFPSDWTKASPGKPLDDRGERPPRSLADHAEGELLVDDAMDRLPVRLVGDDGGISDRKALFC